MTSRWVWIDSVICLPIFITGLSEVIGSWNTIAMCAPQYLRICFGPTLPDLRALEPDRALAHDALLRQQAHDRARQHGLARARLADDAERAAALERERHAVDRVHEPAVGVERASATSVTSSSGASAPLGAVGSAAGSCGHNAAFPHVEAAADDVAEHVEREHGEEDHERGLEHDVRRALRGDCGRWRSCCPTWACRPRRSRRGC